MKEYYAATKEFKLNGVIHKMKKFTLGLQADIENDNMTIHYSDVIKLCTDLNTEELRELHEDQVIALFNDIAEFTNDNSTVTDGDVEDGESKKP